ncbi:Uncharacterized protein LOK49_LG05G03299 [Camellia lanceoleosa]|uniref:Uncharacterized protein n=1 Tax=Camellia lanceoleosa TaxID=1840588 RepID=A0ACC0HVA2_9ERIC|nr:Uncharacterized protein LOK49_LG05G03299 [Camellia lanceoleosa]
MEATVEALSRGLSLTEAEEDLVALDVDHTKATQLVASLCLIGKLLSVRPVNLAVMRATLVQVWRLFRGVKFSVVGENLFLLQFDHLVDKTKVLTNGPWSFDKHLLLLDNFDGSLQPSEVLLTYADFWIHAYDLPLVCMTREVGLLIGRHLGEFLDMDYGAAGTAWGRFLRIRVKINVSHALRWGMKISLPGRNVVWVSFTYERLPNFCYFCGKIGHGDKDPGTTPIWALSSY